VDDWTLVASEWLAELFDLTGFAADDRSGEDSTQVDHAESGGIDADVAPAPEDAVVSVKASREVNVLSDPVDTPEDDDQTGANERHQP
ncbi:MAG: hypothetical protein AB7V46_05190, partial [Thermomicrobiales bacterium]